jgi:hypothetical protein
MANYQHTDTLTALFQLWGFPEEAAREMSNHLFHVDNNVQDRLIQTMTMALAKKQSLGN